MFHLNKNFGVVKKDKIIVLSVLTFLFIIAVAIMIVSSFYKYDLAMSEYFFKGMDYSAVKAGASYTIMDGYNLIVSFSIPCALIIAESIYIAGKNKRTKTSLATKKRCLKAVYIIAIIGFFLAMLIVVPSTFFKERGFSRSFAFGLLIDLKYSIPEYILSVLMNTAMFSYLTGYVHYRLAKQKNFLENAYWKSSIRAFVYLALLYILTTILKQGFGRPHPYRLHWHEYLDKINEIDGGKYYKIYMGQSTFNYGWAVDKNGHPGFDNSFPTDLEGPGYKVGKGFFNKNNPYYDLLPHDNDFPSGHYNELAIILYMSLIIFGAKKDKRSQISKGCFFGLIIFFGINEFFAMEVGQGHGASDMSFAMIGDAAALPLAGGIYNGCEKLYLKISK